MKPKFLPQEKLATEMSSLDSKEEHTSELLGVQKYALYQEDSVQLYRLHRLREEPADDINMYMS